ncbi:hypothetical protein AB0C10_37725 [Microbispora amethystogenes]|uniref:hypothetical protein n=1 Tax=Microbispora amethystogenes TaxID=1427754 RepID=UPI0033C80FF7
MTRYSPSQHLCCAVSDPCPRHQPISDEVASHVLAHFGHGGYLAGSFTRALMHAIASADPSNQHKLALGFPEYVAAVRRAQNERDGIATLQKIARGEL